LQLRCRQGRAAQLRVTESADDTVADGRSRPPHLRTWRDGWRNLRFLLLFSPVWLFFYPGLALLLLGVVGMAWILPGTRFAFGIGFDVNTLVFTAAGIVCGFQAIVFYMFAKTYAIRSGLLPADPLVTRLRDVLRLEIGLLGEPPRSLSASCLRRWLLATGKFAVSSLDPQQSLRIVVPSTTLLIVGLQIMFSSCLLSILHWNPMHLPRRHRALCRIISQRALIRSSLIRARSLSLAQYAHFFVVGTIAGLSALPVENSSGIYWDG